MRVLLDTNVLIASLIAHGTCREVVELCVVNHTIVLSDFVLNELADKLARKFSYEPAVVADAVELFRSRADLVTADPLDESVSRDPDDDNILAAAATSHCDLIITGDKDLLDLKGFRDIPILSPRQFLDILETSFS